MATRIPSSILAAALILTCVALPGCKPKLTDANRDAVKMDMSPKEVESILGPPAQIESHEIELHDPQKLPMVRYVYKQNGKTVTLHFVDGKLIGQEGSFDK